MMDLISIADPDPLGSLLFCRIRISLMNMDADLKFYRGIFYGFIELLKIFHDLRRYENMMPAPTTVMYRNI
jgi:hypothetical protein